MLTQEQTTRLHELQPRIAEAARIAHYRWMTDCDIDDIIQEANDAIITKATTDPDFLNQTDSYIVNMGIWRARDAARRERRHTNRTCDPPPPTDGDADDDLLDRFSESGSDLDLRITIQQTLAGLNETTRRVAIMLAQGYRKVEIAQALGMSPQSVGYHTGRARQALTGALA